MKRKAGRGALIVIALLFASSGAMRSGEGLGSALAESSEEPTVAGENAGTGDATVADTAHCPLPPAELAAALSDREGRLQAREAAVADKEAALALAETAITTRLAELQAAEDQLRSTLALADGAAEEDIARLVAVYETMKPKDAARLFDAMEADFAAGFLGRMRADAAAAIMAGMTPEKAYAVSAILAGRNAAAPKG